MAQTTGKIPLNIILIGKTGHGKSATGNSILGRKVFKTSPNTKSETKVVMDAWEVHGQFEVKVVDGPGLEETYINAIKNKEQACENMAKALMMCNGGVHAFVLVIKFSTKFTREERKAISDLQQTFGEDFLKNHGIIVITGGDFFAGQMEADETPGKTFDEWCQEQDEDFGNLIKECSPRVVLFNNLPSTSEEEKTRQRNQLLFHAGQLSKEKGLYTTEHFKAYAHMRDKLIKNSNQKILEETIQKRIDLLSAQLVQLSIDSSLEDVDKLEARIQDVHTEIGGESLPEESMKQIIGNLTRLSTTTEEYRRAILEKDLRAMKSHLVTMSQCREALDKIRQITWEYILFGIGAGLLAVAIGTGIGAIAVGGIVVGETAAIAGGTAAVAGDIVGGVAAGCSYASTVVTMGAILLRYARNYLSNK